MRLLFISSLYAPEAIAGAELTLATIADAMVARGHAVAVLTTGAASADCVLPSGVHVLRRRMANLYPLVPVRRHSPSARLVWHLIDSFNPGGYLQTSGAIRRFKPDAIIADTLGGFSIAAWLAAHHLNIPVIQRICDAYLLSPSLNVLFAPPGSPAASFRKLVRWPHPALSRRLARVVSLSAALLDLHHRGGLFDQVPAEIIPTAFALAPREAKPTSGPLRLGFIGQIIPTKGIESLLAGFLDANADATLTIAGVGETGYVAGLKRRFSDPRIDFVGWVSDKPTFFSHIDLCVVPSRIFDTLPTVVIEAFAHHVPVLAAPIGGIPEMIVPSANGFLADLGTADQVARAIAAMAANGRQIRAMAATTAAASARFLDPIAQFDRWESLVKDVVGGHQTTTHRAL